VGRPYSAPISKARRNVELKARDPSPERSVAVCESLGAEARGLLRQRDTYFHVSQGRLKLREEAGAVAQLIAYRRPDRAEGRESHFRIVEIAKAEELKATLSDALGIEIVIAKERRLFIWRGVRIHLDEVEGLGSFIEFEAPVPVAADLTFGQERVWTLREAFGIADADLLGGSYCDLAANRPTAGVGPHGG
jgi:predicted adenylyl cyclase CyaB